LSTTRQAVL